VASGIKIVTIIAVNRYKTPKAKTVSKV